MESPSCLQDGQEAELSHCRKTCSIKEAQNALMEDLKQMGIDLKDCTIRRKRKLATTLSEYPLIHFLRVGEWKMDNYCDSIAHYLKNNPKEAEFWKQNYSEWCKRTKPRQPQPAKTAADKLLVDDDASGPQINNVANS